MYCEFEYEYWPEQQFSYQEDPVHGSDEFRMYAFKIKRCSRTRSHDWTECPFAHRGEKAQRRDPRKFDYCAVACPAFRSGRCIKGDTCGFAHGVFEYWLHPARYRTRACNAGPFCQRKVCFFAHSPHQLRSETKYRVNPPSCRVRGVIGGEKAAVQAPPPCMIMGSPTLEGVSEFLESLRSLKISEDSDVDISGGNVPEIEWVSGDAAV